MRKKVGENKERMKKCTITENQGNMRDKSENEKQNENEKVNKKKEKEKKE